LFPDVSLLELGDGVLNFKPLQASLDEHGKKSHWQIGGPMYVNIKFKYIYIYGTYKYDLPLVYPSKKQDLDLGTNIPVTVGWYHNS
jgi:hypothetical protein